MGWRSVNLYFAKDADSAVLRPALHFGTRINSLDNMPDLCIIGFALPRGARRILVPAHRMHHKQRSDLQSTSLCLAPGKPSIWNSFLFITFRIAPSASPLFSHLSASPGVPRQSDWFSSTRVITSSVEGHFRDCILDTKPPFC